MLRYLILLCAFSRSFTAGTYNIEPGPKYPPTKGEIWPKPQYQKPEANYLIVYPSQLKIKATNQTCPMLERAIQRYAFIVRTTNKVHRHRSRKASHRNHPANALSDLLHANRQGVLEELEVQLNSPCERYPFFNMDESYDLTISTTAKLVSISLWGILRGLESWSQLFYRTNDEIRINKSYINDFPRYPHRGLLLDTSRHFISLENILKTLDAMAMNKLNVFHWHIVDDQSFPYQSEKFPDISEKGAYHPSMVYAKSDIAFVVQYAADRGIRVMPEFDVPGHTRSWGVAYPNILTKCYSKGKVVGLGPMDPTNHATYELLRDLVQEVQAWFPDEYFHVGGDEVQLDCWKSNPDLQKYMKDHNMTAPQLHGLFMRNMIPLLGNKSKPIVWQEVYDEGVPLSMDTIIQVWKENWMKEMISVLKAGHTVIFSALWYLSVLKSGGDWEEFYAYDPRDMLATSVNATLLDNIVGGEACMWGEVVDDTNVISRVWPRASAVAERLWSASLQASPGQPPQETATHQTRRRIEEHACRMRRRGIHAQPPNGPGFCVGAI